ncbi:LPXTG cell wall anchor domain-containing protein [Paucilactobacillus kaifaensis]|uniref:LPXTG cell wall anchor domain-containing protein n=1 Tax=Paucilactobacillus kaifaensis TaxID=2559921 RepID=UPI0014859973|nr:LPXTG cell wall anchor domain-containing protein [Paucilactobacillus kaifaensis]
MLVNRIFALGLVAASSVLMVTTPIRGDTIDSHAQVGFTKATEVNPPNIPGEVGQGSESSNQGNQSSQSKPITIGSNQSNVTQTTTATTNHYLPQTDEQSDRKLTLIGYGLIAMFVATYTLKRKIKSN